MLDPLWIGRHLLKLIPKAQGKGPDRSTSRAHLFDKVRQGFLQRARFRVESDKGLQQSPFQLQTEKVRRLIAKPWPRQKFAGRQQEQSKVTRSHGTKTRRSRS